LETASLDVVDMAACLLGSRSAHCSTRPWSQATTTMATILEKTNGMFSE
jgi:hypothetical protein